MLLRYGFGVSAALAALMVMPPGGVAQTGTIQGTVRIEGTAPAPRLLKVTKNREFCGETIQARDVVIKDGRVAYAVVFVEGLEGEVPPQEFRLSNSGCSFDPPVLAAAVGGKLIIDNRDEVLHNTHLNLERNGRTRTVGNWALSSQGSKVTADRPLRRAGVIDVSCDAHSWMHAKILIFDHPYFAVSAESGAFEIEGVPPGTYTLKAWHEVLGEQELEVTVRPNAATTVEFTLAPAAATSTAEGGR
ncbi:MAG: carboxypeptidase regulatory-like domain-containing protein [Gemmatimonadota bacterium]